MAPETRVIEFSDLDEVMVDITDLDEAEYCELTQRVLADYKIQSTYMVWDEELREEHLILEVKRGSLDAPLGTGEES